MAAPSYTEDLTDIDLAESGSTGWTAFNISGGGGGAPAFGADFGMQGAGCWDKAASSAERGLAVNKTPGTGTVAAGVHIFVWGFNATPGVCENLATRGAYVLIGTGTNAFVQFHVEGSDTYGAAGRVGKCYPVDYVTTSNTGSIPYRTVTGSPGATPTYFGFGLNTNASVKGSNMGCDAIRYGTGAYITAGESGTPATFAGFQAQNDSINNRWGILTLVAGSYELQGRFVIGQNNGKTATLAYFDDSDRNIIFVDTPHSASDFTQIIIDHASTVCNWTNISLTALGTHNRGSVLVNNDSTAFTVVGGTWTGIDATEIRASCSIDGLTWRGCGNINRIGGDILNSRIESSTASEALTLNNANALQFIENCTFVSSGTGHAVDLGTVSSTQSISWANIAIGYAAQGGTAANRMLLVNVASGQTLTINVGAGYTTPTYYNTGPGTVNVVSGQVTLTLTGLVANSEVRIYTAGTTTELDGVENSGTTFAYTYTYVAATTVDIVVHKADYKYLRIEDFLLGSGDASLPIQQIFDRNYSNP